MKALTYADLVSDTIDAVIFDLDGVITDTAGVHTHAWKRLFDNVLAERAEASGETFVEFTEQDYLDHVDGKPRYDGVRSFLASRGFELPEGSPDDPPDVQTVCGLGNRKNRHFRETLEAEGPEVFETSVTLVEALRDHGVKTGCVSSSKNCRFVLATVGLLDHFDEILDGNDAAERGLPGKPAPDTYLDAARRLGTTPERSVMVEDAISGVASGAAGGFAHVVGVDRGAGHQALYDNGATIVVDDLAELLPAEAGR
jgi:beta-phosphoglucomutase family hydrolase